MDDQQRFEEKPDWKGKFKNLLRKGREDVTAIFQKDKRTSDADTDASPLSPDSRAPYIAEPSVAQGTSHGAGPGEAPHASDDKTLTSLIKNHWETTFQPKFAIFSRGAGGGGGGRFGGGGFGVGRPNLSFNSKSLNTLVTVLAIMLVAWVGADLAAFFVDGFIPEAPIVRARSSGGENIGMRSLSDYQVIISRNLFSSLGKIPGDEAQGPAEQNNDPVKTSLPLNLIGTVILKNSLRSVATIEDKGDSTVIPVRIDDEIPGKLKVLLIEPYKVIFRNLSNGRKEFVDMPEDGNGTKISVGSLSSRTPTKGAGGPIEQVAPNNFNIAKNEIDRAMSNINEILTQARAVPHFENGQAAGYKLIQIVPGSIYEKLGLKNDDIICGANGESINDPARALELMNMLKTASQIELCVKRGGRTTNNTYNFK